MRFPLNLLVCCSSCKPRYRRLVDAIYPRSLTGIMISSSMQKLTFYAISHPEKLNRIGQYLVCRLSGDLYRNRLARVRISVEAMDQLLKSCQASPSLNLFIESYLKMVQKLLETNQIELEKLATDMFVNFASIQEEVPSYYRQYDFFISKFSSLCRMDNRNRKELGLRGLRGVIWKSIHDIPHISIWEKQHIDKIVPAILLNIEKELVIFDDERSSALFQTSNNIGSNGGDSNLALQCLRELLCHASFGSLRYIFHCIMKFMDLHNEWSIPPLFATKTFKAILCSIPAQNSSFVIRDFISRISSVSSTDLDKRIGMATVLLEVVTIASSSIGPLLLAIFESLLKLFKASIESSCESCPRIEDEETFRTILSKVIKEFMNALPDYQRIEIATFIKTSYPHLYELLFPTDEMSTRIEIAEHNTLSNYTKLIQGYTDSVFDTSQNVPRPSYEDSSSSSGSCDIDWNSSDSSDDYQQYSSVITSSRVVHSPTDQVEEKVEIQDINKGIVQMYREHSLEEMIESASKDEIDLSKTIQMNKEWNEDQRMERDSKL